tara:strand:+ start:497 stop:775 length:279 start_codon:yes stop_codon:yes gene_type:complete
MQDQNSIKQSENHSDRYSRALDIFIESVHKPDDKLRGCAYNQDCFNELMEVREHVLKYLNSMKRSESKLSESDILKQWSKEARDNNEFIFMS